MPATNQTYNVTELVGNGENSHIAVESLVRLTFRTVNPEQWTQMGGLATIRAFFNPVKPAWYLSIFSEIPRNEMQNYLNSLKV